jgi:hypothetical protein
VRSASSLEQFGRVRGEEDAVDRQCFATALDWIAYAVDIAGGDRGDSLKRIEAGQYPRTVKTTLDGLDQRAGLEGRSDNSARDFFFYSPERPRRRWAGSLTWSRRQMRIIQAISLPDV